MENKARPVGAKIVGNFVPKIARKAFERHGFAAATLITDWARIVGRDMAAVTEPERLKWPRMPRQERDDVDPEAVSNVSRPGGTLILRVDPSAVLEVQYQTAILAERINRYFGYRAVETIKLVQAPSNQPGRRPVSSGTMCRRPDAPDSREVSPGLEGALARLARSVRDERERKRAQ